MRVLKNPQSTLKTLMGRPMEQVDIEALVEWAYRVQCIDRTVGLMSVAVGLAGPSTRSATAVMVRYAELGARVDASPLHVTAMGASADDDALTIHDAVLRLPAEAMALVIAHARGGSRPSWHGLDAERLVADTDRKGKVKMLRDQCRPVSCRLRPAIDPALVEFSRAQYGVWWEALDALAGDLAGRLSCHEALPPMASRTPWFDPPLIYVEEHARWALDSAQKV